MKRANTFIDFKNDYIELFGKKINLFFTSSGHYCVPIKNVTNNLETFNDVNNVLNLNCTSDKNEKKNKVLKLHHQFGHHNYKKIADLLKDAEVNGKELEEELKKVDDSCEICLRYKKSRPRPIVGLSIGKSFNETLGMDLKQRSSNLPVWFLHLVDHATRYSSSYVIYPKKKEEIVRKLFQHWITIFRVSNKYLVDNGDKFANIEFITYCENMNIQICATKAESPWSNGLVEIHNAVLGMTVSKGMKDVNCQLEVAVAWSVSAKNCLKNVYGFSSNQLAFGRNPNYPNNSDNQLPALEKKTSSQIVAENLNAMHSARKEFIKNELHEKLKRAMQHNIRTSQDTKYYSDDLVYYKQKDNNYWKGPGTVIGQDRQQVLVKHSSFYVRVHLSQLQLINNMEENELERRESKLKEQENQIRKKDHNKTIKPKCNRFQQFKCEYEEDETDDKVLQDNTIDENEEPSQNDIIQQSPNNNLNENPTDKETGVENEKRFDRILKPNLKQYAEVNESDMNLR